jgi:catechol-2,3-dioxygenase
MDTKIKAIVLRTQKLSATKLFFENDLGFRIKEFSHQHFVVHTKGLRILFLQSENEFGVELYIVSESGNFTSLKDPNDIKIVVQ